MSKYSRIPVLCRPFLCRFSRKMPKLVIQKFSSFMPVFDKIYSERKIFCSYLKKLSKINKISQKSVQYCRKWPKTRQKSTKICRKSTKFVNNSQKIFKNQRKFVENYQKLGTKIDTVIRDHPKIFQFYAGFSKSRHPKNGIKVEHDCTSKVKEGYQLPPF